MSQVLGKYQGRERRRAGGMIECLIKRIGPTPVTMDGFTYIFTPNQHGHNVAFVQSPQHCERLLADSSYREYIDPGVRAKMKPAGDLKISNKVQGTEPEPELEPEPDEPEPDEPEPDEPEEPGTEVSDEVIAFIVKSYFDDKKTMKAIHAEANEKNFGINRPIISAVINKEKGIRGIN